MSELPRGKEWIVARQLIDGTGDAPQDEIAVAIENGRIAAVQPHAKLRLGRHDRVAEHRDCVLMPGLIDAHVHLIANHPSDHAGMRSWLQSATPLSLAMRAARNAAKCLEAGLTTVRDCGDVGMVTLAVRDAIASGWLRGPRVLAAGTPITTTGGHMHGFGCEADTVEEVRKAALSLCKQGVDFVKVVQSGALYTPNSNPFAPQYGVDELSAVVEAAHRMGRRVAAHSMCAEGNRRALAAGIDTIEHCFWVDIEGKPAYDDVLVDEFAARPAWAVITMLGVDRVLLPGIGDPAEQAEANLRRLSERYAEHRKMREAGVRVVIASDAGARLCRFEDFYMSLACAVEALQMSPVEAIHCSTQVAAEALGLEADIGTVEVGKRADLLLVAGDPAQDVTDVRRVVGVWQGGKCVVADGRLAGPDPIGLILPEDESTIFSASESKPMTTAVAHSRS